MPNKINDNTNAGPAPSLTTSPLGRTSPAAAVPIDEKMPAPITAPIASMIKSNGPNSRRSPFGSSVSATRSAIGLRENSDLNTRDGMTIEAARVNDKALPRPRLFHRLGLS